jgi:hypothetical protein
MNNSSAALNHSEIDISRHRPTLQLAATRD